jgi:uncharacterized protein YlxW (UPF0749 family)
VEPELLKVAASQGLWALLFVVLLFYVLKAQERRDGKAERRENELVESLKQAHATNQQLAVSVQKLADAVDRIERNQRRSA